jgi:iron complex transport system substrate-binding protein
MRRARASLAGVLALALIFAAAGARASPRVMSLDQCADQYVLALAPRAAIVGLSPRAGARDSFLKAASVGLPRRRASSEAVLAAGPQLVVRYWGGDQRLDALLAQRRIAVVKIEEASDFDGVRANIRRVAGALDAAPRGEALIARMDARLAAARGAWGGRSALYLTPSGFTAGPGTLIAAILGGAGLRDAAVRPGYQAVSLERLAIAPPSALVLGFFDAFGVAEQQWGPGRHGLLQAMARRRAIATLPASELGCPAWFAADAVQTLAQTRATARRP